jgi:hypothetical protein
VTRRAWTRDELRALPPVIDVETAGSIFGLGRTASYSALRRGEFPVPTFKVGGRVRVPTEPILDLLGLSLLVTAPEEPRGPLLSPRGDRETGPPAGTRNCGGRSHGHSRTGRTGRLGPVSLGEVNEQ